MEDELLNSLFGIAKEPLTKQNSPTRYTPQIFVS